MILANNKKDKFSDMKRKIINIQDAPEQHQSDKQA